MRDIITIALKVFSIFLIIYFLKFFVTLVAGYAIAPEARFKWMLMSIAITLFLIAIALTIWKLSSKIAGILLPSSWNAEEPFDISQDWVDSVVFTVLGLYVLSTVVPTIFNWLIFYNLIHKLSPETYAPPKSIPTIVTTAIELIIGLWLIFGAKGLRGLLSLPRAAGQQKRN
jgi:hypothetical protein